MPELPEVESVRRGLCPSVNGRRIERVDTTVKSYFFLTAPGTLRKELPGKQVKDIIRLGKYLLMEFTDGDRLLMHLGMTGQLLVGGGSRRRTVNLPAVTADKHTHLIFTFADSGPSLYFRDARKFGKVKLLRAGATEERLDALGPDALGLTAEHLLAACRRRRAAIKSVLLDQSVTAGVGNIYADEALHRSGIRPTRPANRVTRAQVAALAASVQRVLQEAVDAGGSTFSDYRAPDGSAGGFQRRWQVYGRTEEPCVTCNTLIVRQVIGQRSSHYCPQCQR